MTLQNQIDELKKGCQLRESVGSPLCGKDGFYCDECISKAKGMLIVIEDELEFLQIKMADFLNPNGTSFRIRDRIKFLKQAQSYLKEIVK